MNTKSILPGAFTSRRVKGGLNLNKFVKDLLVSIGFAAVDEDLCCTFYPTFPILNVADEDSVTAEEMASIPILGVFIAQTVGETSYTVYIKSAAATATAIVAYNG